ncbi:hypothetical protein D1872_348600 [compost metagenome]
MLVLNETRLHIDNPVTPLGVEATNESTICCPHRYLCLITVAPRLLHTKCRMHDNRTSVFNSLGTI